MACWAVPPPMFSPFEKTGLSCITMARHGVTYTAAGIIGFMVSGEAHLPMFSL